jgi:hypothetical protein
MTSFSVCRVWGLFFAVLPLVMATGYAQEAGDVEGVDVLEPVFIEVQSDELIVIKGKIVPKRGTPEGTFIRGEIEVGYLVDEIVRELPTGKVKITQRFVVVKSISVSGVVKTTSTDPIPGAYFTVRLEPSVRWRLGEIYYVVGKPKGEVGMFACIKSRRGAPGSDSGEPNSQP